MTDQNQKTGIWTEEEEKRQSEMATSLFEELRALVVKRHGTDLTFFELDAVLGAIAGLAGFFICPLGEPEMAMFMAHVVNYAQKCREGGAATVVRRDVNG